MSEVRSLALRRNLHGENQTLHGTTNNRRTSLNANRPMFPFHVRINNNQKKDRQKKSEKKMEGMLKYRRVE